MPLDDIFPDFPEEEFDSSEPTPLLVVDSNPQVRRALAKVFTGCGYAVTCAEDGVEALEMAERHRFPVVISEMNMPRLNGVELVQALSELDPNITCLLLAETSQLDSVLEAVEVGNVYNHFWKPLQDVGDLARAVARAVEYRELRLSRAYLLSEMRDHQNELRALHSRLEQLDKVAALGQMTGAMASDLESPLMSLSAYAKYLRTRLDQEGAEPLSPEQITRVRDYMQEMEYGVQRCYRMVQSVLDYTRVHTEPPGPVALDAVIEETLELLLHSMDAQNIRVRLELAQNTPPVLANPRRLQQVIINLILNAQQALGKTGGTLTVATECKTDAASGRESGVAVRISDTGPGIAPEALPHVFTPFFTTKEPKECLGLGLTIARNIAREWKGDVQVESAPGKGTTVTLTLPHCIEMVVPSAPISEVEQARRAA